MPEPSVAEYKSHARRRFEDAGYSFDPYEKQIQQESGWQHLDSNGNVKTSYSGVAKGIGQLNKNYYTESVWSPPWTNLDTSISRMITSLTKYIPTGKPWRYALAEYNWGSGNVNGYTNNEGVHPKWDGTREWRCPINGRYCKVDQMHHYLDVILGPQWAEPSSISQPEVPVGFSVGEGLLSLMRQNNDEPASDEMFFFNGKGVGQYSEAFGKSGARYVYVNSTNQNYRFLPD